MASCVGEDVEHASADKSAILQLRRNICTSPGWCGETVNRGEVEQRHKRLPLKSQSLQLPLLQYSLGNVCVLFVYHGGKYHRALLATSLALFRHNYFVLCTARKSEDRRLEKNPAIGGGCAGAVHVLMFSETGCRTSCQLPSLEARRIKRAPNIRQSTQVACLI